MRERCDYQPRGGREPELEGMVKVSESSLSRREFKHAKEAGRHGPKGRQPGWGTPPISHADAALPADRRDLNPSGMVHVRNVVSPTVPTGIVEGGPQGSTVGRVGMGSRRKRMPGCNRPDRGSNFAPPRQEGRLPTGLGSRERRGNAQPVWLLRRCLPLATLKAHRTGRPLGPPVGPRYAVMSAEYKPVS